MEPDVLSFILILYYQTEHKFYIKLINIYQAHFAAAHEIYEAYHRVSGLECVSINTYIK